MTVVRGFAPLSVHLILPSHSGAMFLPKSYLSNSHQHVPGFPQIPGPYWPCVPMALSPGPTVFIANRYGLPKVGSGCSHL